MAQMTANLEETRPTVDQWDSTAGRVRGRPARTIYVVATMALDAWFITAAFVMTYWFYFLSGITTHPATPPFSAYYGPIPLVLLIWMGVAWGRDLYHYPKGFSWASSTVEVFETIIINGLLTMAMTFVYRGFSYSRVLLVLGWAVAGVLISLERLLAWEILSMLRTRGRARTRTAIVGLAQPARQIIHNMNTYVEMGYHTVGFIANRKRDDMTVAGKRVPFLGTLEDIKEIVRAHDIELLVIAIPHAEQERIFSIISACDLERVEIRLTSDVLDIMTRPAGIEEVAGIPLLGLRIHPLNTWRGWVKRGIDFTGSLVGLVLLSPLLVIVALLVKLTSKGPVLYRQERVGFDDRPFVMLKFRTMRIDAETGSGPVFAQKGDSRYTPIGGFLRRTSLDELPQLLNVLKGEMSLVGPRPERPAFVKQFKSEVPEYIHRHKVRCGITGWAQVNGLRGRTSIQERVEHDRYYITNWSLGLDCVILLKTIREVLRGENAY